MTNLVEVKDKLSNKSFTDIDWVVISMGKDGAIAKHKDAFYRVTIPTVQAVNPVGSGDSTIAGFAKAIDNNASDEEILKTGMTTGILNTLSQKTGDIDPDKFDNIYSQINIEEF